LGEIHATFFMVGFLPLVGAPLAVVGDVSFTWFLFGADFFDFPLGLRGRRRSENRRFTIVRTGGGAPRTASACGV
jgi:uncharacterized protein involved in cysteine biosynthesis